MKQNERMKIIRRYAGLTQKDVAERMGTSIQNYSQYETGKKRPSRAMLEKIATALGCNVSQIADEVVSEGNAPVPGSSDVRQDALIDKFKKLNDQGQQKALEQLDILLMAPEYQADWYRIKFDTEISFLSRMYDVVENPEFKNVVLKSILDRLPGLDPNVVKNALEQRQQSIDELFNDE